MKRNYILLIFTGLMLVLAVGVFVSGCTKEGPDGPPGLDGEDGADAAGTCMTCHDFSEFILARIHQYEKSKHASGDNIDRNGESCARCHTSKGFRDYIHDGTIAAVPNPTAINCRTCHPIHETYTVADYAVRTSKAVALTVGGGNYDFGSSNLCAHCHQARPISPYPDIGGADITITNQRYGPHYGPQANILKGVGGVEIPGSMPYQNSRHSAVVQKGCVSCHMSPAVGYLAGGHQMNVKYRSSGGNIAYNYSGCTSCHTNSAELTSMMNQNRTEIQSLLGQLREKLISRNLMNENELVPVPKTMTQTEAGSFLNYKFIYADKSYGAHNYLYSKALLLNSLEALN